MIDALLSLAAILLAIILIDKGAERRAFKQIDYIGDLIKQSTAPVCTTCEGGGWIPIWSERPPQFVECPSCFNLDDLPSP